MSVVVFARVFLAADLIADLNDHGELPANVELKVANANERLPYDDGFFDVVHMRHVQFIVCASLFEDVIF
jgi:hypothetical protein